MSKGPKNPERSFGISVGGVLIVIALALWWRGRIGRAEILAGIGGGLLFFGLVQPRLLKWPSAAWWKFSSVLGYINARILLTLMFSLLLVPVSLLWRLVGKDPLARRRDRFEGWTPYPARYRDRTHFERMF
jgi:xanthine/uracil permease